MRTTFSSKAHEQQPFGQYQCWGCGFATYDLNESQSHWCEPEDTESHSNSHSLFGAIRILQSQRDALERIIERGQVPQDFHVQTIQYVIDLLTEIETKD